MQISVQKITFPKQQTGSVLPIVIVFAILFVVLAAGGTYLYKTKVEQTDKVFEYLAKVETERQLKEQAAEEFKKQLAKVSAELQTQDSNLQSRLTALQTDLGKVKEQVKNTANATSSQSWLLAEVEYLLKSADHRILMKEDVKGAIMILKNADDLLKKMPIDDAGLREVRVSFAKDIAALEAYSSVDVPGTYAALVSLEETIDKLKLVATEPGDSMDDSDQATEDDRELDLLAIVNNTFGGYLKVKHYSTDELKQLLSTDERAHLRESMRLVLEQAQTALLRGDQIIFDASLAKIKGWLLSYFVTSDFRVELAVKKVEELSTVTVQHELPDISGSQQTLKRYLADRMRQGKY